VPNVLNLRFDLADGASIEEIVQFKRKSLRIYHCGLCLFGSVGMPVDCIHKFIVHASHVLKLIRLRKSARNM
jgi:hypothetical protein